MGQEFSIDLFLQTLEHHSSIPAIVFSSIDLCHFTLSVILTLFTVNLKQNLSGPFSYTVFCPLMLKFGMMSKQANLKNLICQNCHKHEIKGSKLYFLLSTPSLTPIPTPQTDRKDIPRLKKRKQKKQANKQYLLLENSFGLLQLMCSTDAQGRQIDQTSNFFCG